MKSVLVDKGIAEDKIISLGIFDYLIPNFQEKSGQTKDQPMIVAGNLAQEKAGYLYALPAEPAYNLYGVGFDESRALENETYFGSFLPDELPAALEGGFGLVWDGDSAETCSGVFGEYLRYNNSHKASLYLASGFPLVVWKQSTLSHFVLEKGCGIAVESLHDLKGDNRQSFRCRLPRFGRQCQACWPRNPRWSLFKDSLEAFIIRSKEVRQTSFLVFKKISLILKICLIKLSSLKPCGKMINV